MVTVFDASKASLHPFTFVVPVLILAVLAYTLMRTTTRGWQWILRITLVVIGLLGIGGPIVDHLRVRAALTQGSASSVEGVISAHKRETIRRWSGRSTGVGITSTDRYTSTTIEQFYVGNQWFWLRVNGYPSQTSFTNSGDPHLAIRDGMRARVMWFNDPWYSDETRILRFEIADDALAKADRAPAQEGLPDDFKAFWQRFSQAAAAGDANGVKALTRFPFLFEGTPLDAERFENIWAGIFPVPLRSCFGSAKPVRDGEAWSVSCGVYVYIFENGAGGWRLASFTADPEAAE